MVFQQSINKNRVMQMQKMYCTKEDHERGEILGYCVKQSCKSPRLFCKTCWLEYHMSNHVKEELKLNEDIPKLAKEFQEQRVTPIKKMVEELQHFFKSVISYVETEINSVSDSLNWQRQGFGPREFETLMTTIYSDKYNDEFLQSVKQKFAKIKSKLCNLVLSLQDSGSSENAEDTDYLIVAESFQKEEKFCLASHLYHKAEKQQSKLLKQYKDMDSRTSYLGLRVIHKFAAKQLIKEHQETLSNIYLQLGNMAYKQKEFEAAKNWFQCSVENSSGDGKCYFHLSKACFELEQFQMAKESVEQAIAKCPNFSYYTQWRDQIAEVLESLKSRQQSSLKRPSKVEPRRELSLSLITEQQQQFMQKQMIALVQGFIKEFCLLPECSIQSIRDFQDSGFCVKQDHAKFFSNCVVVTFRDPKSGPQAAADWDQTYFQGSLQIIRGILEFGFSGCSGGKNDWKLSSVETFPHPLQVFYAAQKIEHQGGELQVTLVCRQDPKTRSNEKSKENIGQDSQEILQQRKLLEELSVKFKSSKLHAISVEAIIFKINLNNFQANQQFQGTEHLPI